MKKPAKVLTPTTRDCPSCQQKGISQHCQDCAGHGWQVSRTTGSIIYYVAPGH